MSSERLRYGGLLTVTEQATGSLLAVLRMALERAGLELTEALTGFLAGAPQLRWLVDAKRFAVGDPHPVQALTRSIGAGIRIYYSPDVPTALADMQAYLTNFRRAVFVPIQSQAQGVPGLVDVQGRPQPQRDYLAVTGIDTRRVTCLAADGCAACEMDLSQFCDILATALDCWFTLAIPARWPDRAWMWRTALPAGVFQARHGWQQRSWGLSKWLEPPAAEPLALSPVQLAHESSLWGGGMGRFWYSEALAVASEDLSNAKLMAFAGAYQQLGTRWQELIEWRRSSDCLERLLMDEARLVQALSEQMQV